MAILLALPLPLGIFTGLYIWFSPYIWLNSVFALKTFVWLNVLAIPVLFYLLIRRRWFCRHLCPVGWGCDLFSKLSCHTNASYQRLPHLGKWIAILSLTAALIGFPLFIFLDPLAILNGFLTILSRPLSLAATISLLGLPALLLLHLWFPKLWCRKLCPLGGLQELLSHVGQGLRRFKHWSGMVQLIRTPSDTGRRFFLASSAGIIAGLAMPAVLKPQTESILRPPAAAGPVLIGSLCCRCGNCVRACPTVIIEPHTNVNNVLAWMTPKINFTNGYCLETCNLCSRVCPTGAIRLFSVDAKSQIRTGVAVIQTDSCYLQNNQECVKCKESCPYNAIRFEAYQNTLQVRPVIDKEQCVGCGACQVICPAECIQVRPGM